MNEIPDRITMLYGNGGQATNELIHEVFAKAFDNPVTNAMEDAAVVSGAWRIAVTTDSFVVDPPFFSGGDIGRLAVCGSVNDLLTRGAWPKYLTCGFIIEEGTLFSDLRKIADSMAQTAVEAGISIVAGDTKVVEGNGGVYINTTGIGFVPDGIDISAKNAKSGDVIILSGCLGEHHAAIMSMRLGIETTIKSDNAPLVDMVLSTRDLGVHALRDVTRGGLATVLCELAEASGKNFVINEDQIPESKSVEDFCGFLGLDPLYMGNEGKMVFIVQKDEADTILEIIRNSNYGTNAEIIGHVEDSMKPDSSGEVFLKTAIGGMRRLDVLMDEGLPRIC